MKWTIFYNGAVIIGINFADGAYKKTPTLLRIERVSGSGDISISYDALNFSAIYVFDTNDKLSIDISDIIRIAEINQSGTINVTYDGLVIEIPFVVAGFVAPADVFIPKFNIKATDTINFRLSSLRCYIFMNFVGQFIDILYRFFL